MSTATTDIDISEEVSEDMQPPTPTGGSGATAIDPNAVRQKIIQAKTEDKAKLEERDVEIDLLWNSILSKQHGGFVGTGGVAKSLSIDTVTSHITVTSAALKAVRAIYKVLLRKSMPIEEIVGPLSLKGLENDEFRYILTGRGAQSFILFLDEIFKANAVVLNALLMIVNERIIINDGVPVKVPLWSMFGASNELPTEPELHAFRDRFAWFKEVKPVSTDDGFKRVLRGGIDRAALANQTAPTLIDASEIEVAQAEVARIDVPDPWLGQVATMKRRAEGEFQLFISARRYISGIALCQAQAWLNGRTTVIEDDLTLFQHTLWTDIEDAPKAYEVTLDYAGKVARVTQQLRSAFEPYHNDLASLRSEIPSDGAISQDIAGKVAAIQMNLKQVHNQITKQVEEAKSDSRDTSELDALLAEVQADRDFIRNDILG